MRNEKNRRVSVEFLQKETETQELMQLITSGGVGGDGVEMMRGWKQTGRDEGNLTLTEYAFL